MPVQTVVQFAHASVTFSIPGGNAGSGTTGMQPISISLPSPITATNGVLLAVSGILPQNVVNVITLGPLVRFIFDIGSSSLPIRTYVFQLSFTDAAGTETMLGPPVSHTAAANTIVRVEPPNVFLGIIPNAVTWNLYIGGALVQGGIAPGAFVDEPSTGFPSGSGGGPTTPVHSTNGDAYSEVSWTNGGLGGTVLGEEAMGMFYCPSSAGGSPTIKFVCGFASQTNVGTTIDLDIIAVELTPGQPLAVQGAPQVTQQGNSSGDVSHTITDSGGTPRTTDYGTVLNSAETTVDLGPADEFFALGTTASPGSITGPPGVPTITGGTYALVDSVTSSGLGLELSLWYSGIAVTPINPPTLACPIGGSVASVGVFYSGQLVAGGGTPPYTYSIVGGSLPPGLTLNTSTGVISGIPTTVGLYSYVAKVTDSLDATATITCSIDVSGPVSPSPCPCGNVTTAPTDVQLVLRRVYVSMVPHKRIPVRGS